MKNKIVYILILLLIVASGCQGQNKPDETYLSSPMAYKVEGHNPDFSLPESLSKGRTGNAVIEIFLSNTGKPEGFNLTFLKLSGENSEELRYYKYTPRILEEKEYPDDVRKFLPLFKDYLSGLTFVRNENVTLNKGSKYLIKIPLQLR